MHRSWQWLVGFFVAGLLLVLAPAPEAAAQDTPVCPTVFFTKTVALTGDPCAVDTTAVEIVAGTPVNYCYKLTNPVTNTMEVTALTLLDGNPPIVVPPPSGSSILAPGQSTQTTLAVPSALQPAINATSVTSATWSYLAEGLGCTVYSNNTTVAVVRPRIEVTLRVAGGSSDPCSIASAVNDIGSSQTARYCLKVTNTGNAAINGLVINSAQLGLIDYPLVQSIGLSQTVSLTSAQIPQLQRTVREPQFTVEVTVIGLTTFSLMSDPASNAATSISHASITFRKVLKKSATNCADNNDTPLVAGERVYICYIVTNNGPVELWQQSFNDPGANVSGSFVAEIPVGGTLRINNSTLTALGARPVLGPFPASYSVSGNATFVAQNQTLGFSAQGSGSASVVVQTPTPNPTSPPTPTPVPFVPTWTPSPTWTPFPPTPTGTPTWTPAPTWTSAPPVMIITTPSAQGTPYPAIGGQPPGVPQQPPLDPFVATATASAATATAIFLQNSGSPGGYPAPVDPFAATATANAATATAIFLQNNPGGVPGSLDPFAATATANAATATAIFLQNTGNPGGYPAPVDPFAAAATANAATATAVFLQTTGAPGGYPAPVDPFAAVATANAATATAIFFQNNPGVAPADPFAAVATANAATATAMVQKPGGPGAYPAPVDPVAATATAQALQLAGSPDAAGATATALAIASAPTPTPPLAEVTATATAAALAAVPPPVVVTPTPDPNVTLAPTQRPVEAPTPAPRGDPWALLASVLDAAVATFTFLGLLAGAGLFFLAAAVLIVLTVRTRRADPYSLTADDAATFTPEPPAAEPSAEDHWPTSLP